MRWRSLQGSRLTALTLVTLGALSLGAAKTAKPPEAVDDDEFNPSEEQHVVESGESLWSICDQVTGKPWVWPRVWAMNPEITNPHWVYPGDIVRFVPPTELPPTSAELVASKMDVPDNESIENA